MTHSSKNHPKFLPNFHLVITLIVHKRYVHLLDHCNMHSESLFYFICHTNFILFKCFKWAQVLWTCFFLYLHLQELQDSFYKPPFVYIYVSISPAHTQRFYCWLKSYIQFSLWNLPNEVRFCGPNFSFYLFRMSEVNKELFDLQQQLKQVHQ